MPNFNRKGPEGKGPMTGRQMGICMGNKAHGFSFIPSGGRGFERHLGFGNRTISGRRYSGKRFFSANQILLSKDENIELQNEIKLLNEKVSLLEKKISTFQNE